MVNIFDHEEGRLRLIIANKVLVLKILKDRICDLFCAQTVRQTEPAHDASRLALSIDGRIATILFNLCLLLQENK